MTEPSSAPTTRPGSSAATAEDVPGPARPDDASFERLDERPVADHVAVFETEHARLQRELGTIDQL